ncbi:hypothetical protein [Amedibacillus sp. YH-ame10]
MKTYKQINEELEIPEELILKTVQAMSTKQTTTRRIGMRYATACVMLCLCVGIGVLYSFYKPNESIPVVEEKSPVVEAPFNLNAYVKEETFSIEEVAKTSGDISGIVEPMNEEVRNQMVQIAPTLEQLHIPTGFTSNINYMQYWNDEKTIGPYANLTYHFEKGTQEAIDVFYQDERMPRCIPYDIENDDSVEQYKGYKLTINKRYEEESGNTLYWVHAYRKGYIIQMNARIQNEEEFSKFLESFLI